MMNILNTLKHNWRLPLFVVITISLLLTFNDATMVIWARWGEERYSHAPFVLALAIYLIWIKRHELTDTNHDAWLGVPLVLLAGMVLIIGELSAIWTLVQYGMVFLLFGLMWSFLGRQTNRIIIPFLHVLLVVPLPYMLDVMLSGSFQLMSSKLGVDMIRMMDITVLRDGNIIDLGIYKLQVVEACSGLNYTYPLMTIGLMMAYMYKAPFYARVILFFTTIPISIVMNSFRIAIVALLVENSGIEAAEGFMHYFEGWVIFILCLVILLIEVKILNILTKQNRPFGESFDYLEEEHSHGDAVKNTYINKAPIFAAVGIIVLSTLSSLSIHHREEIIPERTQFAHYPLTIDGWNGQVQTFKNGEEKILKLKDYFLANYYKGQQNIDVYYGYTDSQRNGFVPHSPKACIPGGGWEITKASVEEVNILPNKSIKLTRLLISKDTSKMLVYYWFHQRGRDLSSEFPMKFYLLHDSIKMNRTDGAIVRFVMQVKGDEAEADKTLAKFIGLHYPLLPEYIPD